MHCIPNDERLKDSLALKFSFWIKTPSFPCTDLVVYNCLSVLNYDPNYYAKFTTVQLLVYYPIP